MNILIRGGGFSNKGDEAMMLTVLRELGKRLPGANFWVRVPESQAECAYVKGLFPSFHTGSKLKKGIRLTFAALTQPACRRAAFTNRLTALELGSVPPLDAVVDVSGYAYSDVWGIESSKRALAWARHCKREGIPFVFMPQAWGPFRNPSIRDCVREMCQNALVYARDNESKAHLTEALGPKPNNVALSPDIAFDFQGGSHEQGAALLESIGIGVGGSPIVALTPNMRAYERCSGLGAGSSYIELMTGVAAYCIDTLGAAVLLIPHEFSFRNPSSQDDRFLCGLISNAVSGRGSCATITDFCYTDVIRTVYEHVDLVIGSRFHSLVFALASGVPVVAVGWAHKYGELLQSVDFGEFALSIRQGGVEEVCEKVERAWERRTGSRAKLAPRVARLRGEVKKTFDVVAQLIRDQTS